MRWINALFSAQYAPKSAIKNNLIQELMYRAAFPVAKFLAGCGMSPNVITTGSVVFALLAAIFICAGGSPWVFAILWLFSLVLDLCDGTVARMTMRVSKVAFRYDHYSDLFKFASVGIAVVYKHSGTHAAIFSYMALFFFMLHDLLHKDVVSIGECSNSIQRDEGTVTVFKKIIRNIFVIVSTINGHTFLLIAFVGQGEVVASIVYGYIATVAAARSALYVRRLMLSPR